MAGNIKHQAFTIWAVFIFILMSGYLPVYAADRSFFLQATGGYITAGDGSDVYMWSFTDNGTFRYPGPLLEVNEGDWVTIFLSNRLPDPDGTAGPLSADPVSLVFPGQEGVTTGSGMVPISPVYEKIGDKSTLRSLANEALPDPGNVVQYTFHATKPGTYYYQSGTYIHKHIDMGLFGGLIVHPAGYPAGAATQRAYATPDTAFDREYFLLMSALDPVQHRRVEQGLPYEASAWLPSFWFINGRSFPDTLSPDNAAYLPYQPMGAFIWMNPGERILFRMATVDRDAHPFHHHGNHATLIAVNGTPLQSDPSAGSMDLAVNRFTETVYPGETQDAIFTWNATTMIMGWDVEGQLDPVTGMVMNPVPVVVPPIQNDPNEGMVYGEFYSGSPYLKKKGSLPTGHTDVNQQGEHYMIFHSHHEHELQNLNEGLGGLATQIGIFPTGTQPLH